MPKRTDIKELLIIGSGPIVIGQAPEFDYSGAQACKALRTKGPQHISASPACQNLGGFREAWRK